MDRTARIGMRVLPWRSRCASYSRLAQLYCSVIRSQYEEFQKLADKCLMTLKMEARCQCYYYLTTLMQKVCLTVELFGRALRENRLSGFPHELDFGC